MRGAACRPAGNSAAAFVSFAGIALLGVACSAEPGPTGYEHADQSAFALSAPCPAAVEACIKFQDDWLQYQLDALNGPKKGMAPKNPGKGTAKKISQLYLNYYAAVAACSIATCGSGEECCESGCSTVASDSANCGQCSSSSHSAVCSGATVCVAGRCECEAAGNITCKGQCVDPFTDKTNCGTCGNVCTGAKTCDFGACACPSGLVDCDGECKQTCCPTGQIACEDGCTDPLRDSANCGACGNACLGGMTCMQGSCQCPTGTPDYCSGTCINTQNDPNNCGSCGKTCPPGELCAAGGCRCSSGKLSCTGGCKDPLSDNDNCGACGNQCVGGAACMLGTCECPLGTFYQNGICISGCVGTMNGSPGVRAVLSGTKYTCPSGQQCTTCSYDAVCWTDDGTSSVSCGADGHYVSMAK